MDFKKKFFRYLLNHYLGQFLEEKFSLDQLTVDLYNGRGNVKNVALDCQALNQVAEEQNIPVEFIEVTLGSISVSVPWMKLMQESCHIEVSGLYITIQPKNREDNGSSMLNSMFSMASSMHLAEDFIRTCDEEDQNQSQAMPGLEAIAKTIEAVLTRIKVNFHDSVIRVERAQRSGSNVGIALELRIKSWNYSDESGANMTEDRKLYDTAFQLKKFSLQGIKVYSDIFKQHSQFDAAPQSSNEENPVDNLTLMANFTGLCDIGLRIKTDESMGGPQISLDCSFGSMIALLTPVQAHIFYLILEDFLDPPTSPSHETFNLRQHLKEKPMDSFDFMRIKEELEETNRKDTIGLPGVQHQGWSSSPFDDDPDERFLPFKTKSGMFNSTHSNLMETSMTSEAGSMNQSMMESTTSIGVRSGVSSLNSPYKSPTGQSHLGMGNSCNWGVLLVHVFSGMNMIASHADKTKFAISIASAAVILLHEDILALSSAMAVAPSTAKEMQKFAVDFFEKFGIVNASGGKRQVDDLKASLEKACPKSCLRLIAAPVKLEGNISIENSVPTTTGHVSFATFQLVESLKDNDLPGSSQSSSVLTEVLNFSQNHQFGKESLKIEFKHRTYRSRSSVTKTDIRVHLQECESEFDMSIIDRLNSLLQPKLPVILNGHKQDNIAGLNNKPHNVIFLKVTSPKCCVDFRFPIPDMRKSDDQNKIPYWTRNVRSDSIIFKLKELSFNTCINSQSEILEFDTQCQECALYYKTKPTDTPLHFATASANDIINNDFDVESPSLRGFDRPRFVMLYSSSRVVVSIFPERKSEIASENTTTKSEEDDSLANFISMANFKTAPSPFSSRRVVHECLSSNPEDKANGTFGESVIPGDQEDMKKFMDDTTRNVLYRVDCNLRSVQINMPSKEFFEELYNRLSMDLLLWEPLAPKQSNQGQSGSEGGSTFRGCVGPQKFSMCKSGIRLESDESDSDEDDSTFYPSSSKFSGRKGRGHTFADQNLKNKRVLPQGQSEVTINLVISHGVCAFFTPFEDVLGNIIPELKGQVTLEIEKGNLFIVSGYKGSRNSGYLCLHSHRASFFHSELVKSNDLIPRAELKRIIYPSEEGVVTTRASSDSSSLASEHVDMLSVAIKIDKDELKNIKNFKVAVGIKDGTIDYRMSYPNRNWFTQIVDFFDVTDVCVEGYTPSAVITELHVHLWNCAASYAPLQLPLRSILTVENFSISVNIAAQTNMKVIRFIAEDAALFITNKKESSDLRHDYVCVMDMDLFELLLRICVNLNNDPAVTGVPQLDLKASNNVLHVRTCSDSIKVLLELITHLANNGDLPEKDEILSELEEMKYGMGIGTGIGGQNQVPLNSDLLSNVFFDTEEFPSQQPTGVGLSGAGITRERKLSQNQNIYPNLNLQSLQNQTQTQIQTDHLHTMVAEAMQENPNYNFKRESNSSKKYGSSYGSGKSPKSRSASGSSGSVGFGIGKSQSIEIHFDPGQKLYGIENRNEEADDFNGNGIERSNVSTPAQPFHRDDPIMESCDGLPVSIQLSDEDEEQFCILENDPGVGFLPRNGEPEVRVLTNKPIELIENHFSVPMGKVDILQAPKHYPKPITRFTIQEMSLVWHLYDGEDFGSGSNFRSSNKTIFGGSSETLSHEFTRGDSYDRSDPSEIDLAIDALNPGAVFSKTKAFESPWEAYDSPKSQRRHSLDNGSTWRVQGGKGRNHDKLVELQLSKIKFQHEVYPQNTEQASRQVLIINTVEVRDKLKTSLFNKMLYLYTSPSLPKQSFANMVVIKAAHIRPDPQLNIEECCLKVSLLPIRLNIDQDTILFLYQFFTDLVANKSDEEDDSISSSSARPPSHTPSCESLPVMMVNTKDGGPDDSLQREKEPPNQPQPSSSLEDDSASHLILFGDDPIPAATSSTQPQSHQAHSGPQDDNISVCSKDPSVDSLRPSAPIYFREVIFSPEVPMRIDYRGKNVYDMTNGPIAGILMALGQLESAEIRLIRLTNNRGILGVGRLFGFFGTEWVADIRTNQIPSVLGGVDIFIPMHSFVQLFQGVKNLFYLPVEQYQKDGRLAKGLQRGVNSFSTSAAMAVLKLTNRMVQAFQGAAEFTYDMVSPGPSVQQQRRHSSTKKKRYSQPSDMREGVTNAYNVVREGLGDTAHNIVRVVSKENEQKGVSGAVGGVLRQIPPALIVKPMILVAEATSNVLEGLKSQLEPDTKKEAAEKWKDS